MSDIPVGKTSPSQEAEKVEQGEVTGPYDVKGQEEHLHSVLLSIRKVNQLLVKERDRKKLLQGVCDILVENRDFYNAWVALLDEELKVITVREAGIGKAFGPMEEVLRQGKLPTRARMALERPGVVTTRYPAATCRDCPLSSDYEERGSITVRLEHERKVYGLLSASIPRKYVEDEGEHGLFAEVAGDIAFGLHRIEMEEQRHRAEEKLRVKDKKLEESFIQLAETTTRVLGVRDPYTQNHEERVAEISREVGKRMGMKEDDLLGLYLGGLLHDIGKIAIPETILTKPGKLDEVEWEMIKTHPVVGYQKILKDTDFPWPVAEMTLHHHERLDGSGYPDGLEGEELTPEVRIIGTVDVVEAMLTDRPYRSALPQSTVLEEIQGGSGVKYDPEVVSIVSDMVKDGELAFD